MSSINPQEDQQQPFKDEENTENQEAIPIGQPVAFFAEIETVSLLMKYEKIFESISEMAFTLPRKRIWRTLSIQLYRSSALFYSISIFIKCNKTTDLS